MRDHASIDAMLEAAADPSSGMAAGMRGKLMGAVDYLPAARRVVQVVTSLEVDSPTGLPAPVDVDRAGVLAQQWNLGGSMDRIVAALSAGGMQ